MRKFIKNIFKNVADKKLDSKVAEALIKEYISEMKQESNNNKRKSIAVIGMACNFGKADNTEEFWNNIQNRVDCLQEVPQYKWNKAKRYSENKSDPLKSYSKWGSFIKRADQFDSEFFNQSDMGTKVTDPQQRLFLHLCCDALDNAGYGSENSRKNKSIGVFVGARGNVYNTREFVESKDMSKLSHKASIEFMRSVLLGKAPNMIAAAVSNHFNLKGPSMVIDSACSSSLVSVHMACQSIISGDCCMAIAGGVEVIVDPNTYVYLSKINALSPDGKCKTFDKNANGYVPGEGGGAVILKELDKAIEDKDNIIAVIKGSAVNNDGYTVGVTTPDIKGQKDVIRKAFNNAGVKPEDLSLIEAHGTGTFLGDPVEFRALTEVFRESSDKSNYCALGTIKSNIGHLHSAAGIASFIKIALALSKKKIPATINCERPNPRFNIISSPFYIADNTSYWKVRKDGIKRSAGISSFGFGGTNCHMILEEINENYCETDSPNVNEYLAVYSAKNDEALYNLLKHHLKYISTNNIKPSEYSYTLNVGRELFKKRRCVIFQDINNLKEKLLALTDEVRETTRPKNNEEIKVVMMFSGQGSQYYGMARELYKNVKCFRKAFDKCDAIIGKYLGKSIKNIIYSSNEINQLINRTSVTQPVTFAIGYSIGKMWMDIGVKPDAVLGHSVGEYVAACIAGVLTLEDAVKIVVKRAQLMDAVDVDGGMMVVFCDEDTVRKVLDECNLNIYIAALNGPTNTVISGINSELKIAKEKFINESINVRELAVSHPFHSKFMLPMIKDFELELKSITMQTAKIPVISNVTGEFKYKFDVDYWLSHILKPVKFEQSILSLTKNGFDLFLEAGSGKTLTSMIKKIKETSGKIVVSTINPNENDWRALLKSISTIIMAGLNIDFDAFYEGNRTKKIVLPGYPFNYKRYWIDQEKTYECCDGNNSNKNSNLTWALFDYHEKVSNDEIYFEKKVEAGDLKVIKNHIVDNNVVMPGVCFWEMAQIASIFSYGKVPVTLKRITYPSALIIKKDISNSYRLVLNKSSNKFKVISLNESNENNEKIFAAGSIDYSEAGVEELINIVNIKQRLKNNHFSGEELNEKFKSKGLMYGKDFYAVTDAWGGRGEAITELKINHNNLLEQYMYHPGIVDGALQGIALVDEVKEDVRAFVPYRVDKISYLGLLTTECYGYIKLINYSRDKGIIEFNVLITDKTGKAKIVVTRMCIKAINKQFNYKALSTSKPIKEFYTPYWLREDNNKYVSKKVHNSTVLMFVDNEKHYLRLSEGFKNEGYNVVKVYNSGSFSELKDNCYSINPHSKQDYDALFNKIYEKGIFVKNIVYGFNAVENETSYDKKAQLKREVKIKVLGLIYVLSSMKNNGLNTINVAAITNNAFIVNSDDKGANYAQASLLGVIKTIPYEYGNIKCSLIDVEDYNLEKDEDIRLVIEELANGLNNEIICFRKGKRYIQAFRKEKFKNIAEHNTIIKDSGVYIIAGGLGGIGLEIAKSIAYRAKSEIILIGRSAIPKREKWNNIENDLNQKDINKIKAIEEIESRGSHVLTLAVDICNEMKLTSALEILRLKFGHIDGIINAAGVLHDSLINQVTEDIYYEVISSKILGSWILDIATEKDNLDFFVLFSAMVTYLGNVGQACYTSANAFEDSFAAYRNFTKGKKTLVINWGTFSQVGLMANNDNLAKLEKKGVNALSTEEAVNAFYSCLNEARLQYGIAKLNESLQDRLIANSNKVDNIIYPNNNKDNFKEDYERDIISNDTYLEKKLRQYLVNKISELQSESNNSINLKTSFLDAGLDSMTMVNFTEDFENDTAIKMYPTILFEYPTIQELSNYLLISNKEKLKNFFRNNLEQKDESQKRLEKEIIIKTKEEQRKIEVYDDERLENSKDIAVIGMSGIFPKSNDIYEYWDNIVKGINCISEIPIDRWDWKKYYNHNKQKGKTYSKWGGFVDGIGLFDPAFFNISPKEATTMDPQQRLFMEVVWEALEDAAYADGKIFGTKTGVFVGVSNHNYFDEAFDANNNYSGLGNSNAIVANRISYFLNLKGPSMSIDTQCSSSLVAIHEACKSIILGESDFAIAGGVNLLIPKDYYILLSQMEAISKDGSCKAFDKKANGFVSGEGAGALILKRLSDAVQDGDNIHCIIKASEINHDGRSGSLTAPNSKSQAELIKACIDKSGVNPETITYIEAHGTGTVLGDPIEVTGLVDSFTQFTNKKNYCGLGSVKSNIGHLESAAGMASVIKVIMSMKKGIIPKSLHFKEKNPFIDFVNSPFYIVDRSIKWVTNKDIPRRAGVSSFGMGGTNAHIILEQAPEIKTINVNNKTISYPIFLSAKNEKALKECVVKLFNYLKQESNLRIEDISYTLNTGRYKFNFRLAIVVNSLEELILKLEEIILINFNNIKSDRIFYGEIIGNDSISYLTTVQENSYKNAVIIFPECNEKTFEMIKNSVEYLSKENRTFKEVFNEGTQIINELGLESKIYGREKKLYTDTEVVIYTCIFYIAMYKVLKDLGIEASKFILSADSYGILDVLKNRVSIRECILGIINKKKLNSTNEYNTSFEEITNNEIVINLGNINIIDSSSLMIKKENVFNMLENVQDNLMRLISQVYVCGGNINFNSVYLKTEKKKISLPTYSFQLKNYWHTDRQKDIEINKNNEYKLKRVENYFYEWSYKKVKANSQLILKDRLVWIVFCDNHNIYKNITKYLNNKKQRIVLVFSGENFIKKNNYEYIINLYEQKDFVDVFKNIMMDFGRIDSVINLWSYKIDYSYINDDLALKSSIHESLYSLFGIAMALYKIIDKSREVNLISITNESIYLNGIDSKTVNVETYPIHILSRLIVEEMKGISSRTIDLGHSEDLNNDCIEALFKFSLTKDGFSELVYRNGQAYIRILREKTINLPKLKQSVWKNGGIYVITGGANGIGAQIGLHISKSVNATIILIGRTKLPYIQKFEKTVENGYNKIIIDKMNNIREMKQNGSKVEYYNVDISDEADTMSLFNNILNKFGSITGVFHCAGAKKDSIMTSKSFNDFDEVMKAKVLGINNIKKAVSKMDIEFVMAFSSIAALYGTPGQSDYSCANAFMDSFIKDWSIGTKTFVTSINWTLWDGVGMNIPKIIRRKMEKQGLVPLKVDYGMHIIELILASKQQDNYIIMNILDSNFIEKLNELKMRTYLSNRNGLLLENEVKKESANLQIVKDSIALEVREFIIKMISELLYLEPSELDTTTSLDEYGMDSLSIKDGLTAIEQHYNIVLEPSLFEENKTVNNLVGYLVDKLSHKDKNRITEKIRENSNMDEECDTKQYAVDKEEKSVMNCDEDEIEDLLRRLNEGTITKEYAKLKIAQVLEDFDE